MNRRQIVDLFIFMCRVGPIFPDEKYFSVYKAKKKKTTILAKPNTKVSGICDYKNKQC